ncbi:MAG: hypothetical protein KJ914_17995 [Gammaproteobacteria bacterium]|nr:hypothetical protein [Gammaproteobacteria bacterium]MBU1724232.1 hypothetical protein [Gammaproteobacteria bacterium]MBU2006340.1 hypothetical protein [Gammaproteobacteria bacterium]
MGNKAKTFLFAYYWVFPVVVFLALIIALGLEWLDKENQPLWLTLITGALGWAYFFQKQKLEEDKLFLDSFEKFNKRFHDISNDLDNFVKEYKKEPQSIEILMPIVHRYFDLCIEEYQIYKKGRIPEETWCYWATGICEYLKHHPIRQYWKTMGKAGLLEDGFSVEELELFLTQKCKCRAKSKKGTDTL